MKFGRRADVARRLGLALRARFAAAAHGADLAIPIPLHRRRLAERGFNQAQVLLHFAARKHAIAIDTGVLRRHRATAAQSGLGAAQRTHNVAGAFSVSPRRSDRVRGKSVVLVDDTMSTGATLGAATRVLLDKGAHSVRVFVVARTC